MSLFSSHGNHDWVGHLGIMIKSSALSCTIFCKHFAMMQKGGKALPVTLNIIWHTDLSVWGLIFILWEMSSEGLRTLRSHPISQISTSKFSLSFQFLLLYGVEFHSTSYCFKIWHYQKSCQEQKNTEFCQNTANLNCYLKMLLIDNFALPASCLIIFIPLTRIWWWTLYWWIGTWLEGWELHFYSGGRVGNFVCKR